MAQAQSAAAVGALTILVNTLLANRQPLQAIKCLEAICCSSAQMPAAAAKTRLQLARLMLEHTRNISEATQHLQQAVSTAKVPMVVIDAPSAYVNKIALVLQQLLLSQVPAEYSLKCQISSELGRCHRYLARPKLEQQVYQRAPQMCAAGHRSADRCRT